MGPSEVSDDDVWDVLKNEMSEAATVIQSNYRGYRARKQLQREDAVQVLTSSSSVATNGVSSIDGDAPTRNSGELHDIIALTPPNIEPNSKYHTLLRSVKHLAQVIPESWILTDFFIRF